MQGRRYAPTLRSNTLSRAPDSSTTDGGATDSSTGTSDVSATGFETSDGSTANSGTRDSTASDSSTADGGTADGSTGTGDASATGFETSDGCTADSGTCDSAASDSSTSTGDASSAGCETSDVSTAYGGTCDSAARDSRTGTGDASSTGRAADSTTATACRSSRRATHCLIASSATAPRSDTADRSRPGCTATDTGRPSRSALRDTRARTRLGSKACRYNSSHRETGDACRDHSPASTSRSRRFRTLRFRTDCLRGRRRLGRRIPCCRRLRGRTHTSGSRSCRVNRFPRTTLRSASSSTSTSSSSGTSSSLSHRRARDHRSRRAYRDTRCRSRCECRRPGSRTLGTGPRLRHERRYQRGHAREAATGLGRRGLELGEGRAVGGALGECAQQQHR